MKKELKKLPCGIDGFSCAESCFHIVIQGGYKKEFARKIDACYRKHKKDANKKVDVEELKYKRNRQRGDL